MKLSRASHRSGGVRLTARAPAARSRFRPVSHGAGHLLSTGDGGPSGAGLVPASMQHRRQRADQLASAGLVEGWPSYHLERSGDDETLVRHRGNFVAYGVWRLGTPVWRRFAVKERTTTVDALKASFGQAPRP